MDFLKRLFGKQQPESRRAMAFVDYEHWYYSYQNNLRMKPEPLEWRRCLEKSWDLDDIMVFGDFGYKGIHEELVKIRNITNTIIETQNSFGRYKKDMTDFIMLDYIYQTAYLKPEIGTYILFTGDGHFQSVVKYLTQKLGKTVIVYGVKDSFSNQLKSVATHCYELPDPEEIRKGYYTMIASNLAFAEKRRNITPTFKGTVAAVVKHNSVPEEPVREALQIMMDRGLVYQEHQRVGYRHKRSAKVLCADWEKLKEAGLWPVEQKKEAR